MRKDEWIMVTLRVSDPYIHYVSMVKLVIVLLDDDLRKPQGQREMDARYRIVAYP